MHDFMIGAWISPIPGDYDHLDNPDFINEKQYQYIAEAGLNAIYGLYETVDKNEADVFRALDMAQKADIYYLVRDRKVLECKNSSEMKKRLDRFMNHPASMGVLAVDEPGYDLFQNISRAKELFKSIYPDKFFYVNMLPLYATDRQIKYGASRLGGKQVTKKDYKKYLEKYINTVKPNILSYDFYPFEGPKPEVRDDYFTQLDMMSGFEKPLWCFIQTVKFNDKTRIPTLEEIRFQINTSLAYNHKGIQFFTYFKPLSVERETFDGAMIDQDGNKTDVYESVKQINKENNKFYKLLHSLKWQGIWANKQTIESWHIPKTNSFERLPVDSKDDILIARYTNQHDDYDLIVNLRMDEAQSVRTKNGKQLSLPPAGVMMIKNEECVV